MVLLVLAKLAMSAIVANINATLQLLAMDMVVVDRQVNVSAILALVVNSANWNAVALVLV